MPRYGFDLGMVCESRLGAALRLAAERFPEIALEVPPVAPGEPIDGLRCTCRAPSTAHLHRWFAAARLPVITLHRLSDGAALADY